VDQLNWDVTLTHKQRLGAVEESLIMVCARGANEAERKAKHFLLRGSPRGTIILGVEPVPHRS